MPDRQRDSVHIWIRWLVCLINRRIFTSCDRRHLLSAFSGDVFQCEGKMEFNNPRPRRENCRSMRKEHNRSADRHHHRSMRIRAFESCESRLSPALPVLRYFIANCSVNHEPSYTVITMRKLSRSAGDRERQATTTRVLLEFVAWASRISWMRA